MGSNRERVTEILKEIQIKTTTDGLPANRFREIAPVVLSSGETVGSIVNATIDSGGLIWKGDKLILSDQNRTVSATFSQEDFVALKRIAKEQGKEVELLVKELALVGLRSSGTR